MIKSNACKLPGIYHVLDHWWLRRWWSLFTLLPSAPRLLPPDLVLLRAPIALHILWSLSVSVVLQTLLLLPRMFSLPMPGPQLSLFYEPKQPLFWKPPSCTGAGRSPLNLGLPQYCLRSWYSTSFLCHLAFLWLHSHLPPFPENTDTVFYTSVHPQGFRYYGSSVYVCWKNELII